MNTTWPNPPAHEEDNRQISLIDQAVSRLKGTLPFLERAAETAGGQAAYAQAWRRAGFGVSDVTEWLEQAHCFDVESAARLCAAKVLPREAQRHSLDAGGNPRTLGFLVSSGQVSLDAAVKDIADNRYLDPAEKLRTNVRSRLGRTSTARPDDECRRPFGQRDAANVAAIREVLVRLEPTPAVLPTSSDEEEARIAAGEPGATVPEWTRDAAHWDRFLFKPAEVEAWIKTAGCYQPDEAASLRGLGITPQMASCQVMAISRQKTSKGVYFRDTVARHLCHGNINQTTARHLIFEHALADQVPLIERAIVSLRRDAPVSSGLEVDRLLMNQDAEMDGLSLEDEIRETAKEWASEGFTAEDFEQWVNVANCYQLESAVALRRGLDFTAQEAALLTERGDPVEYEGQRPTVGYKVSAHLLEMHDAEEVVYLHRRQERLAAAWQNGEPRPSLDPYTLAAEPDAAPGQASSL